MQSPLYKQTCTFSYTMCSIQSPLYKQTCKHTCTFSYTMCSSQYRVRYISKHAHLAMGYSKNEDITHTGRLPMAQFICNSPYNRTFLIINDATCRVRYISKHAHSAKCAQYRSRVRLITNYATCRVRYISKPE